MKRLNIIAVMVLCLVSLSCSAQRTLSEVSSIKGVTSVYVGKAMLRLAGGASNVGISNAQNSVDISKLLKSLTSIEVVTCDEKRVAKEANDVATKILNGYPFEVISEVKDEGASVEISGVFKDDGEKITMLLIKSYDDDDDFTIVLLHGEIDMATLESALNK